MDTGSWFSVMNLVLVVAGIAVGAVAGHFASPSIGEAKRLHSELDRMRREHESYRDSINAHFRKTADLVGQMTKSYAAVYDHLAGGARTFCDETGPGQKLPFEPLPGELASPVVETPVVDTDGVEEAEIETAAVETVAADWPTDVMLGDATDDSGEDTIDEPAISRDSKAATTNSSS